MSFSNIGSAEGIFAAVTSASDTTTVAVPDLATQSIGIVCAIIQVGTLTITTATWGGSAMTEGVRIEGTTEDVVIFYLANPPDNANRDIVVSYAASAIHTAHIVVAWADAGAAVTLDDTSSTSGTIQNPVITSTQAGTNELVISASATSANAISVPSTTDCTELQSYDSGGRCSLAAYSIPAGSGNVNHTHNYSESGTYAIASVSFKEAAGPGGATYPGYYGPSGYFSFILWIGLLSGIIAFPR